MNDLNTDTPKALPKQTRRAYFTSLFLFIALALFLRGTVVEAFKIPSGSMLSTLQIGDHLLVTKFDYSFRLPFINKSIYRFAEPKRGEIVVFTRPDDPNTPEDDSSINIIKRVIGLPGDTVVVEEGQVKINDIPLIEPYATWVHGGAGKFGPYKVPANHVFLLGDNRDESKDSRFWSDPFLDMDLIKGKALIIYFNINSPGRIGKIIQ